VHAGASAGNRLQIDHTLGGFEQRMDQDRFLDVVFGFEQGQKLINKVNIPWAFNFRDHDYVEFISYRSDDFGDVVEHPWAVECIHPYPERGVAKIGIANDLDETGTGCFFSVYRNGIFKIAAENVNLFGDFGDAGANLFHVGRKEMNDPFGAYRRFSNRLRGTDGEWIVEVTG
jgi:hypothetical protein